MDDSISSPQNYRTKSGVTKGPDGVGAAIFAYNHADWYVNDVLYYAKPYVGGIVLGDPTDRGAGIGNPNLPPLTHQRTRTDLTWAQSPGAARPLVAHAAPTARHPATAPLAALLRWPTVHPPPRGHEPRLSSGVTLRRGGYKRSASPPYHPERSASLRVS